MTDKIIEMAREAGFDDYEQYEMLKRFAALVRADEREACAKVCMKQQSDLRTRQRYATAIRASGNK
jgi:hypothetical protein